MIVSVRPFVVGMFLVATFIGPVQRARASQTALTESSRMFRGTPDHIGVSSAELGPALAGVAWTVETGGPIRSTPALHRGILYFGSSDGKLYAVSAIEGSIEWTFDAEAPIGSSPAVAGDLIIFGDRTNTFRAIHREDGRLVWSIETGPDLPLSWGWEGWDYIAPSPVVVQTPSGVPEAVFASGNGSVYAVDARTGSIRWRHTTEHRFRATPAVYDGTVYIGGGNGVVYALDQRDGSERWTFETTGTTLEAARFGFDRTQIQASAAVHNGVVYVGSRDASMYAIRATTGDLLWHVEDGSAWVVSSAAVRDGMVFNGRSSSGNFRRLDAATGQEQWVLATGGAVFSSPLLVGNTVYFGNGAGWVNSLNIADGSVRWRFRTGGGIYSSPVSGHGNIYVGSDDGHLYALQLGDGPSPRLAVYWDDSLRTRSLWGGQDRHRLATEYFERYGYERIGADGLVEFMNERIADAAASVVIFGMDALPDDVVAGETPETTLLRRYLAAGGKVVWMGPPPGIFSRNEQGAVTGVDRDAASTLLDVDLSKWDTDEYGSFPTPTGRSWGIQNWMVSGPSASVDAVDVALIVDELGRATSWLKSYGGPPGRGFVFVPPTTSTDRLDEIRRVAEIGVMRPVPNP